MDIKKLLVRSGDTLLCAIELMDRAHMGVALVVDGRGLLVGIVVDGDVRRALIRGKDLGEKVETVMTRDPVCVPAEASDAEVVQLLQGPGFAERTPALIPAVDAGGRPVGLYSSAELLNRSGTGPQAGVGAEHRGRIVVIGGAGYIGSVLVRQLLDAGHSVTVLDSLLYGDASIRELAGHPRFEFVKGDTRHIDDLVPVIRRAGAVAHLAELVGDPLCERDPQMTFEINCAATSAVARMCGYLQVNRFVYLSSCSVYGASSDPDAVLDERSELAPVSVYARTKINSERLILSVADGNFSPVVLRLGTVFGLSQRPRFDLVVNTLSAQAVREGKVRIHGGGQWRPFVHVADVGRAISLALEAPLEQVRGQVFNVVGASHRIDEVGEMIAAAVPGTRIVREKETVDRRNYRVSGDRARDTLGLPAPVTVKEGIQQMVSALRSGAIGDHRAREYTNARAFDEDVYGN